MSWNKAKHVIVHQNFSCFTSPEASYFSFWIDASIFPVYFHLSFSPPEQKLLFFQLYWHNFPNNYIWNYSSSSILTSNQAKAPIRLPWHYALLVLLGRRIHLDWKDMFWPHLYWQSWSITADFVTLITHRHFNTEVVYNQKPAEHTVHRAPQAAMPALVILAQHAGGFTSLYFGLVSDTEQYLRIKT